MERSGFSLLELLFVLFLAALLLSLGIPALNGVVLDSRRTGDINAFVASVQLARSEAAKRGQPVILCKSSDGLTCGGRETQFDDGWLVVPENNEATPLVSYQPRSTGSIRSNRAAFTFRPNFARGTNGTVTFCDHRGSATARNVIISYTGRPRVASTSSRGEPIACPA